MLPARASMLGRRSSGISIQPRRHPVMPQYLEKEETTQPVRLDSQALTPRAVTSWSSGSSPVEGSDQPSGPPSFPVLALSPALPALPGAPALQIGRAHV